MGLRERLLAGREPVPWHVDASLLLCPTIPRPLHGVAPRVVLGSSWWNKENKKAKAANYEHCEACGVSKLAAKARQWMEGHEWYDIDYEAQCMYYRRTVCLCHYCHNYIHIGRLSDLLAKGEVHHAKYVAIVQHGDGILAAAGLERPEPFNGPYPRWANWRLSVNGKLYPPKFKSEAQWRKGHGYE